MNSSSVTAGVAAAEQGVIRAALRWNRLVYAESGKWNGDPLDMGAVAKAENAIDRACERLLAARKAAK